MRLSSRPLPLPAVLLTGLLTGLLALPGTSCIAVAGAGAGAAVTYDALSDQAHFAHVNVDVDQAWPATLAALADMNAREVNVQNYPRRVRARIYDGEVYIEVQAFDMGQTVVRLQFRKRGLVDSVTGQQLLQDLVTTVASESA